MKDIANLARIVTSRAVSFLPVLDLEGPAATKECHMVQALLANPDITANQMVKVVYGPVTDNNLRAMQKMQSRVRSKLLNHLYFLDHTDPRHVVSRRFQLECLDLLHKVSILFAEGEYLLTEQLLKKCMRLAQEGEFTQYTVQSARMLCTLYAELRQAHQFEKMDAQLVKASKVLEIENEAERLHASTLLALGGTVKSRQAVLKVIPEHLKKLDTLHRQAGTFNTYLFRYRLLLALHELQGNYSEISRLTGLADKQLREGTLNARRFDKRYNSFMRVFAHLRARRPSQGLKLAKEAIKDFHPSSNNWFYFQENHVLLALHAQEYDQAHVLLTNTINNPAYSKQRPAAIERWDLYRAYAEFVQPPARVGPVRRMQIAQWAHTLPEFSRDKTGQNIAILIFQMLHYMRANSYEEVMTRLERLRKYQQRHMGGTGMVRSRLFLRLLHVMADCGFNAKDSAEKGRGLLKVLENTVPPGEAYAEVEIIPYEHLWVIILQMLLRKKEVAVVPEAGVA